MAAIAASIASIVGATFNLDSYMPAKDACRASSCGALLRIATDVTSGFALRNVLTTDLISASSAEAETTVNDGTLMPEIAARADKFAALPDVFADCMGCSSS
jgi:hypothetical protein